MSSPRTLFLGIGLAFLSLTNAAAIPDTACAFETATPVVPFNGGITELPTSNYTTLVAVTIGRGIQNYTCAGPFSTAVAIGAIATLFDATDLAYKSTSLLNAIPPLIVGLPLPRDKSLRLATGAFKVIGHHFFNAQGVPTFDLNKVEKILYAAKVKSVTAPSTASKGPAGTGAVDWLLLEKRANYTSVGVSAVYRVVTAGGVAPACEKAGLISVQYAAEYWFFN